MTKERLQVIKQFLAKEGCISEPSASELIAEVERLNIDCFVPHVGPPDTTPGVRVPIGPVDARDGGL